MTAYNATDFDPPAPVAYVTLRNEATGAEWSDVPMQLDTGADVTLVPQAAVNKLGLTIIPDMQYELVGFEGSASLAVATELKLLFGRGIFSGRYLLLDQEIGVIGRDILNFVPLLFDGPRLDWSEYQLSQR